MGEGKGKLWTPAFLLVLAIALLSFIICQGNNNGSPIYISFYGGNNLFAGLLILEFSLAAAVVRIFLGRKMDTSSRKRVMLAGAIVTLAGSFGAVLFPVLELQVIYRALQGLGFGLCTTAASTAAADIIPLERLGEGLGYYGLGQSLGMVIGPSLAIVLVSFSYHESLFVGMSILGVLLILAVLACNYEKHPERLDPTCAYRIGKAAGHQTVAQVAEEEEEAQAATSDAANAVQAGDKAQGAQSAPASRSPRGFLASVFEIAAFPGALPMLVICFGYSIVTNFASKFGVEQGIANPGMFFICAAITMTLVRIGGGRFLDSVRPLVILVIPVVTGVVCFWLLATTPSEVGFYIAGICFGISMGLSFPLFNTVAVRCSPIDRRGAATALYLLANDLGVGIGAVIAGEVIDVVGYAASFWGGAAMMIAAFIVGAIVFPRGKDTEKG